MFDHPVTFKEADDAIGKRMDRPTAAKYKDIMATWSAGARQRAFFSSRVMDATVLSELHRTVQKVVSGEMTDRQAVRIIRERFAGPDADALSAMGFAPKQDAHGVSQLASIRRIKLVMHTNARMAQECGHFRQWEAVRDMYPYGIWHCGYAEEHRKEHLARDGRLYPFEHPIWRHSPPGGEFNCHCWREPVTADDASGMRPEPMDSAFEPSSLGFDPSMPMDGEDVQPGKRVLPSLSQKAKAQPCPDDVLADMDAQRRAEEYEEARRENALNDALEKRRREFSASAADYSNLDVSPLPDTIKDKAAVAQMREEAAEQVEKIVPDIYTMEAMKYGRPPTVCYDELCEKTLLSPDGLELVIGRDIIHHPEKAREIIGRLDFVNGMKNAQEHRREFAKRQIRDAKILGIDVKDITFVNDLKTRERLREEAIKLTNPNYSTMKFEWTYNCQRVVTACEARLRGLNVVAMPRVSINPAIDRWAFNSNWTEFFDGGRSKLLFEYGKTVAKLREASEEEMKNSGEGSHFIVAVQWKGRNAGGHVFNAEVKHGKVIYYDAQSGENDYSCNWNGVKNSHIRLLRIDNLDFNANLREAARKK